MALGLIPARIGSERLPEKALAEVHGRPLIAWVIENAARARSLERLVVATDDERIARAARKAGVEAVMTDPALPSGTDRIAAACRILGARDPIVVNIQGDEPELDPDSVDAVVRLLENRDDLDMATAAAAIRSSEEFLSPHRVKVVTDRVGRALYFSRAPIPHHRDAPGDPSPAAGEMGRGLGHLGLYAYRRDALADLVSLEPSPLERIERLEQLRALQAGMSIGVAIVGETRPGIDTPEDLEAFRRRTEGAPNR